MAERILPRYPIYIPSKGRYDSGLTARYLLNDDVAFKLVVEPQERDKYVERFGAEHVLVLPFRDLGSVIPARNWILEHAKASGALRHWQLDDNIASFKRRYKRTRIRCNAANALAVAEDFTDRYENVAISGLNYEFNLPDMNRVKPYQVNCQVYSCTLALNSMPQRWRNRYNEDTDICLQVLASGWCTLLINVFCVDKMRTMTVKGGNTDVLYQGDGRLEMSRSLERSWPGIVRTYRRFGRPQHFVNWSCFDTPLKRRSDITIPTEPNEYGLELRPIKPVKHAELKKLLAETGKS
jgi:hypothetical protein